MKPTKTLVAAALATMVALPAAAEELKFASFVPPQHTVTKSLIDKLANDLKEKTGGALTVRNYPGGELGKGPVEQYVRALQGVADISWGLQGYTSSQFPKSMLIELPGMVPVGKSGADMLWNAFDKYLAPEFPGTVPLGLWVSEPNVMIMKSKDIRTLADLKGLNIRVAGAVSAQVVSALGATPVQMPITKVYNALDTGLIDGVFTGSSAIADFKLHEVASSYTIGVPLGRISFYAVMNKARFDGLPADRQKAVREASGRGLSQSAEDAWHAKGKAAIEALKADSSKTVIELTPDQAAPFAKLTMAVSDKVIKDLGAADVVAAMKGM